MASAAASVAVSYEEALKERLRRVRGEIAVHAEQAVAVQRSLKSEQRQAEEYAQELAQLRKKWAEEQLEREALMVAMGSAERRLVEREQRFAEAWALHMVPPVPSAALASGGAAASAQAGGRPTSSSGVGGAAAAPRDKQEREQRQRLANLEVAKSKLVDAMGELRQAAQQEVAEVEQLRSRVETLRKESDALRSGADAAREGEERLQKRLEGLAGTTSSGEQRLQVQERQLGELQKEVQGLRFELAQATAAAATAAAAAVTAGSGSTPSGASMRGGTLSRTMAAGPDIPLHVGKRPASASKAGHPGSAVSAATPSPAKEAAAAEELAVLLATNRQLRTKADALREELRKRRSAAVPAESEPLT